MNDPSTVIAHLEKNRYRATPAQVEELAALHCSGHRQAQRGDGTYLRVLIAGTQAELGAGKRGRPPTPETQEAAADAVHTAFYAAVLRGVSTPDLVITADTPAAERKARFAERNRRAAFARSAKSTLIGYVRARGDVRKLNPARVTKAALREQALPKDQRSPAALTEARVKGATEGLVRALERIAELRARAARLERAWEALQVAKARWVAAGKPTHGAPGPNRVIRVSRHNGVAPTGATMQ